MARYLVNMVVSEQRIMTAGYGPSRPVAHDNTPEAYTQNRRVVIEVAE
ncbi:hypothetical protein QUF75_13995 [Desulfococcaceae bacterium HSG7]|nr:hypothetical protein [Desulfococcaceae bacterium HSG7]